VVGFFWWLGLSGGWVYLGMVEEMLLDQLPKTELETCQSRTSSPVRSWAWYVLFAAGVYNLAWGIWVVLLPQHFFQLLQMEPPRYPQIWQCVGMVVGVYGIGYLIAAADPVRHWPIVFVGLLGKIFGPIGFVQSAMSGALPWSWGALCLFNDLVWWLPFSLILWSAFRHSFVRK
jgi:small multidrug resistance pump